MLLHPLKQENRKLHLPTDHILPPQLRGFTIYLRGKDGYYSASEWLKTLTLSCIEGSSWLAPTGLPGRRVGERANEIFFTAAQNHFTHLMKLSRIVQATVKLGICVRKFYKQKCLKKGQGRAFYESEISLPSCPLPTPDKFEHFIFSRIAFLMLSLHSCLSQFC